MKQSFIDAFEYKAWANQELLDFGSRQFGRLPEEDATFFVRILNHTAVVDALFIARIHGRPDPFKGDNTVETPTLDSLRSFMRQNDSELINIAISCDDLDRPVCFSFTDGDSGRMSIAEIFLHLLTHGSNHRGMAARTLASNQLARPSDTFTRFLHGRSPERRHAGSNAIEGCINTPSATPQD